jgi:hypothetical protein
MEHDWSIAQPAAPIGPTSIDVVNRLPIGALGLRLNGAQRCRQAIE